MCLFSNLVRNCTPVLLLFDYMHWETPCFALTQMIYKWLMRWYPSHISRWEWDGIERVPLLYCRLRVWKPWRNYIFKSLCKNHACLAATNHTSLCDSLCVCTHVLKHFIIQAWVFMIAVKWFTIARKKNLFYIWSYKPHLFTEKLHLAFSFSLPLFSKDYRGAHRQISIILHLGRPYTLLLHVLHAYTETAHWKNCGFNISM